MRHPTGPEWCTQSPLTLTPQLKITSTKNILFFIVSASVPFCQPQDCKFQISQHIYHWDEEAYLRSEFCCETNTLMSLCWPEIFFSLCTKWVFLENRQKNSRLVTPQKLDVRRSNFSTISNIWRKKQAPTVPVRGNKGKDFPTNDKRFELKFLHLGVKSVSCKNQDKTRNSVHLRNVSKSDYRDGRHLLTHHFCYAKYPNYQNKTLFTDFNARVRFIW